MIYLLWLADLEHAVGIDYLDHDLPEVWFRFFRKNMMGAFLFKEDKAFDAGC